MDELELIDWAALQLYSIWLRHGEPGGFSDNLIEQLVEFAGIEERAFSGERLSELVARLPRADLHSRLRSYIAGPIASSQASEVEKLFPRDGFVLGRPFRSGGMGTVYQGWQASPSRPVAIKVTLSTVTKSETEEFNRLLLAEKEKLGHIDHPNVVQVLFSGILDTPVRTLAYVVMLFVHGHTLRSELCGDSPRLLLRSQLSDRLRLFVEICAAIEHIHSRGVVHGDIKPENVVLGHREGSGAPPKPKIIDLGLAAYVSAHFGANRRLLGTPPYIAPELFQGKASSVSSDEYALGVILYELLGGDVRALPSDTHGRTVSSPVAWQVAFRIDETASSLRGHGRDPTDLALITARATHDTPSNRYPTIEKLANDVQRYLAFLPIGARSDEYVYRLTLFWRRHRTLLTIVMIALALLIGASVYYAITITRSNRDLGEANAAKDNALQAKTVLLQEKTQALREAQIRLSQALLASGYEKFMANDYADARALFCQSADVSRTLGASLLQAQIGIWKLNRVQPLPLAQIDFKSARTAIAAGGRYAISCRTGLEATLTVWALPQGIPERQIKLSQDQQSLGISALAVSRSASVILFGCRTGEVWLVRRDDKAGERPVLLPLPKQRQSGGNGLWEMPEVCCASISEHERFAATAHTNGEICVWDLNTKQLLFCFTDFRAAHGAIGQIGLQPLSLALNDDLQWIAYPATSGAIVVKSLVTGAIEHQTSISDLRPVGVQCGNRGEIYYCTDEGGCGSWDPLADRHTTIYEAPTSQIPDRAFAAAFCHGPPACTVVGGFLQVVHVIDQNSQLERAAPVGFVSQLVEADGSNTCWVRGSSGSLCLISLGDDAGRSGFSAHTGEVSAVAISRGGFLGASSSDGEIIIWDALTRRPLRRMTGLSVHRVSSMQFSPSGHDLVIGTWEGEFWSIQPEDGKCTKIGQLDDAVLAIGFQEDKGLCYLLSRSGTLVKYRLADWVSDSQIKLEVGKALQTAVISYDGLEIFGVPWPTDGRMPSLMASWYTLDGSKHLTLDQPKSPAMFAISSNVTMSADDQFVLADDGDVTPVWSRTTGKLQAERPGITGSCRSFLSGDLVTISSVPPFGRLSIDDVKGQATITETGTASAKISKIATARVRPIALTGGEDGIVEIWDFDVPELMNGIADEQSATFQRKYIYFGHPELVLAAKRDALSSNNLQLRSVMLDAAVSARDWQQAQTIFPSLLSSTSGENKIRLLAWKDLIAKVAPP
jgi:serine/threonine protein kinase/WD40 repeat protein